MNENVLHWHSPLQTHEYAPIYLANGYFGGMLNLSGATMDLWSLEIGAVPKGGALPGGALSPVTALRTQVFFRNEYFRGKGFWVGASGVHCRDPRYTSDSSMPHIAQVYDCRQELDLRVGIADPAGVLALGSSATVWSGARPERQIAFRTRVIFLKDSPALGLLVEAGEGRITYLHSVQIARRQPAAGCGTQPAWSDPGCTCAGSHASAREYRAGGRVRRRPRNVTECPRT